MIQKKIRKSAFLFFLISFSFWFLLSGCGGNIGYSPPQGSESGWVSSGGELLEDSQNPWWVKNTREVSYCIDIDTETISTKPENIEWAVEAAIAYWKSEFSRQITFVEYAQTINDVFHKYGVGTQNFTKITCTGGEDLRFQFGYNTLKQKQIDYLKDPTRYVAISIRTHYDKVNLRGKGFIYIGSDLGPNRFQVGKEELAKEPWKVDILLLNVIVHELGHVFGIPHIGPMMTIMSEQFPDLMVQKTIMEKLKNYYRKPQEEYYSSFFFPGTEYTRCNLDEKAKSFFEISEEAICMYLKIDEEGKSARVSEIKLGDETPKPIGKILDLELQSDVYLAVMLRLNPLQNVFNDIPLTNENFYGGPFILKVGGTGAYVGGSGKPKSMYLNLNGSLPFFALGIIDGKLEPLVPQQFWGTATTIVPKE